jgi:AbrB family looped-hinge helix DNA binding protein
MRTTIDKAGRVVVPKRLRDELGLTPGRELELTVVDGHLELTIPSRVRVEEGPHGIRFAADTNERLTAEQVRNVVERGRR